MRTSSSFLLSYRPIPFLAATAGALLLAAGSVQAHQLSDLNGRTVQHNHVYKRNSYGQGITSGHVAPTPHGNDMIIWSPAPSNNVGTTQHQLRFAKPRRTPKPNRASGLTREITPASQIESRNKQGR